MATTKTEIGDTAYKVTFRHKGTISNWSHIIYAPDKDTTFFRAVAHLEGRGIRYQTIIERIRKVRRA